MLNIYIHIMKYWQQLHNAGQVHYAGLGLMEDTYIGVVRMDSEQTEGIRRRLGVEVLLILT